MFKVYSASAGKRKVCQTRSLPKAVAYIDGLPAEEREGQYIITKQERTCSIPLSAILYDAKRGLCMAETSLVIPLGYHETEAKINRLINGQ